MNVYNIIHDRNDDISGMSTIGYSLINFVGSKLQFNENCRS